MAQPKLSLSKRLLAATALTLLVFLGLVFVALEQAFVSSVTRTEADKLQSTILLLLAEAEADSAGLVMPDDLQEARFSQPGSGLYGFVFAADGSERWRSNSAIILRDIPQPAEFRQPGVGVDAFGLIDAAGEAFLYSALGVSWELDPTVSDIEAGSTRTYTFALLESADFFHAELAQFRRSLLLRLLAVGVVLLVVQLFVLRLGLRPLQRLSRDVQRVEEGDIDALSGDYPKELQHLTNNLNALLVHEQRQREHYRNRLSDLAHSLKTPLSIASGALLDNSDDRQLLAQQLQQMDQIVQYQLQRASRARPAIALPLLPVAPMVRRLGKALGKVYAEKGVNLTLNLDDSARCRMDESDLMELLGNVLENAYKYGSSQVHVSLLAAATGCSIEFDDDGPGIPVEQREHIFTRGRRLDTQRPGQGIGLAVVEDIVSSYSASISLDDSTLGGARFRLVLPG